MIPSFPQFKHIELSDKAEIESFTKKIPCYSDINFISIWNWFGKEEPTDADALFSVLNNNLVIKFTDYETHSQSFLAFIGETKIDETAEILLVYSQEHYHLNELRLIPEEIARCLNSDKWEIIEDRDQYDYILDIENLMDLPNWKSNEMSKRNLIKFQKNVVDYKFYDVESTHIPKIELINLFYLWAAEKKLVLPDFQSETDALKRYFDLKYNNLRLFVLKKGTKIIGFKAIELINNEYAMLHFSKANVKINEGIGIYETIYWLLSRDFLTRMNLKFLNIQQDLGIPGLRRGKEKLRPVKYLKKYIIKSKEGF
ncbi:MAG: phosphatidylglycerol lysyltransferase domain-containing protein [Chitinophagaceae bacterium]|nr:phosphatidylglycerol lysyltransferase domain-containing protein [Chitinophagaceae bacterium]